MIAEPDDRYRVYARRCIQRVKTSLGPGWEYHTTAILRGLVMAEVVGLVRGQDESISAERRLAMLEGVATEVDAAMNWSKAHT